MPGIFEPNLLHDHFRVVLNQGFLAPWSGVIFRSVWPRYARPIDIVSGGGSYRAGRHWNAPRIYAIYGSIDYRRFGSSVSGDLGVPGITVPPTLLTALPAKKPDNPSETRGVPDL